MACNVEVLRIIYSDKTSWFEALLENDASFSIFKRNIQLLATETHNASKGLSSPIIAEVKVGSLRNVRIGFI